MKTSRFYNIEHWRPPQITNLLKSLKTLNRSTGGYRYGRVQELMDALTRYHGGGSCVGLTARYIQAPTTTTVDEEIVDIRVERRLVRSG
ncbi:2324_t:CDS:2 [Acaulospora colombiana]|uniref:2324_t:CDS:1 n=1 Tax=Acaulospora colombiana TaxID=27376 RepID=A0ACA9PDY4_9GLOM|nr:2324_t:CDS:2 [Acaulospora colombiana]